LRFGICCRADEAETALAAGFDYVELPLSWISEQRNPPSLQGVEATNLFFPANISIYKPDEGEYLDYAEMALERAADLGVEISVLGSGGVRKAPVASGGQEWEFKFAQVASELSMIARKFGIVLAPESLNRSETNVGNDLGALARLLREQGVSYTADSYHILYEWRAAHPDQDVPLPDLWETDLPFRPAHVHLADLPRYVPSPDDPMLRGFVDRLRTLGYDNRVSLEATRGSDLDSLSQALRNVKKLFLE
jgi:sugar phosphate isomerase/epimerase